MADQTGIEWADSTFNPWMGCSKVSPACDHCYAERDTARFGRVSWGQGVPRVRTSVANWRKPLRWNARSFWQCADCGWRGDTPRADHADEDAPGGTAITCPACLQRGLRPARRRVFCASLADVFDNEVDPQWRADLFDLILRTPNLDWLLLTKRIGNVRGMLPATVNTFADVFPNVWLGATVCNQEEADRDVPKLLATPVAVRFLSIEPMLSAIKISSYLGACDCYVPCQEGAGMHSPSCPATKPRIDWVIAGGESGPDARPLHPDWIRSLRDQCAEVGVPFLFKQWGEWTPHASQPEADQGGDLRRGRVRYLAGDGREPDGQFRRGDAVVVRAGKRSAGRVLDGRTHSAWPSP